jgi:hypothetical protein
MTTLTIHPHRPTPPADSRRRRFQGTMQRCPCCQLTIRQRHPQMALDYCPRCIARTRELVPLLPARA